MAIPFSDNFNIGVGNPIDAKYLNALNQPYANTGETNTRIPQSQRYIGLTVNIGNAEYWYKNGVSDTDLILKTFSGGTGGGGTITGATNGLGVDGKNICLGGAISPSVVITDAAGVGIQYGADYSSTFSNESLITKRYADSQISGTTYHIPIFKSTGFGIQESTLTFFNNVFHNSDNLTIDVPNTKSIYFVANDGGMNNTITLGKPTLGTGVTVNNICVAGQAANIGLWLSSKGTSIDSYIFLYTPDVYLGSSGRDGIRYSKAARLLRLPQSVCVCMYGGYIAAPDATPMCIIGGDGLAQAGYAGCGGDICIIGGISQSALSGTTCRGGNIVLQAGCGYYGGGADGNIYACYLPHKASEVNVVYYNTSTGKLSYGLASGGTGNLITGGTNGLSVSGLNIALGGTLNAPTAIYKGVGNTAGIEYGADYSSSYSDRSLIDKAYANTLNERVNKLVCQTSHGFAVKDIIGYSGSTYNKAIANGLYNGEILGIVTKCYNADCFDLTIAGYISQLSGGTPSLLNADTTYFLSDTTAGLLTPIEPTTLGHVSKAVIIADSAASGWILPYAGYVISSGITGGGSNTMRICQTSHGLYPNDVVGWSGGSYNKAIANGKYNGEVIGIVNKRINSNVFDLTQAGYVSGLTGLTMNTTYFLSDSVAGQLSTNKPTVLGHVVRAVIITDSPASGWVLPYPGYLLTTGSTTSGTTVGAGIGICNNSNVFDLRITDTTSLSGYVIPVKIDSVGARNFLFVDSADITGGTGGGTITGATNIGTGTGIYDSTSNKNLQFLNLVGSGSTSISQVGNDIVISSSGGSELYTYDSPSVCLVGGLPIGSVLTGKTANEILSEILVPVVQPAFNAQYNSIVLSPANGTICEIGYSIPTVSVTSNFNRGSYSPAYCGGTPYGSGVPNTHTFTGSGVAGSTGTTVLSVTRTTSSYLVAIGTQSWTTSVAYDAGVQAKNSKGGTSTCPIVGAGTCGPQTASLIGVYPLWATCSVIATPSKLTPLYDMSMSGYVQITLVPETGGNKQKFEIPCAWIGAPTNNPLIGVRTWVGIASAWCYLNGGTAACSLTEWTPSSTAETVQGNSIGYCQYTFNGTDRSTTCIRLEF